MNRVILILLEVVISISCCAQNSVAEVTIDSANNYYNGGEYDKCVGLLNKHSNMNDLVDDLMTAIYWTNNAKLFSYASKSIHSKYSYEGSNITGAQIMAFFSFYGLGGWLSRKDNMKFNEAADVLEYAENLESAVSAASVFLFRGLTKDQYKMIAKWRKTFHNLTFKRRKDWSGNPQVQLAILYNSFSFFEDKGNDLSKISDILLDEYWDSVDELVELSEKNDPSLIIVAKTYVNKLQEIFKKDIHSRKPNFSRSLDMMLKCRDFSYFATGAKQYSNYRDTSWENIQACLEDGEYCMEHFEEDRVNWLHYEYSYKPKEVQKRINYTLIFDRNSTRPLLEPRGYAKDIEQQGFHNVISQLDGCKRIYTTGTDYMMLKDYVKNDGRVYRLHSLSQLTRPKAKAIVPAITFVGCIDFGKTNHNANDVTDKGGIRTGYQNFATDQALLAQLKALDFAVLDTITAQNVTKEGFINGLKNSMVVHISTHGQFDNEALSRMNDEIGIDVVNGANIFKNCKLLLSGYNEDNSNYISAEEIKNMDLGHIDMLFLDACQTAAGRQIGLGSYSLAEAFHIAGVKNIVATLDSVDPQVTQKFSERLYSRLLEGDSIHDAFYRTKQEVCPDIRIILWE